MPRDTRLSRAIARQAESPATNQSPSGLETLIPIIENHLTSRRFREPHSSVQSLRMGASLQQMSQLEPPDDEQPSTSSGIQPGFSMMSSIRQSMRRRRQRRQQTPYYQDRSRAQSRQNESSDDVTSNVERKPRVNMTTSQVKDAILSQPRKGPDNCFLRRNNCSICMENFRNLLLDQQHVVFTQCGHVYCLPCAKQSIKPTRVPVNMGNMRNHAPPPPVASCPCCRAKLTGPEFYFRLHLPEFKP